MTPSKAHEAPLGISEILSGSPEDIAARIWDLSAGDKLRLAADIVEYVPRLKGTALGIVRLAELEIRGVQAMNTPKAHEARR